MGELERYYITASFWKAVEEQQISLSILFHRIIWVVRDHKDVICARLVVD